MPQPLLPKKPKLNGSTKTYLLELTPNKDVLFITGDWNEKVGSQANLALEYRMKQDKG